MNQDYIKTIGIKDESRNNAYLYYVNQVEGLKDIYDSDFVKWSNFDSLDSFAVQQWIFARALDIHSGKKIDIRCDCCEYVDFRLSDFEDIKIEKCFGKKTAYIIQGVLDEIISAKTIRENDGTYSV